MERKYRRTLAASYIGYITQAITNNFAPLLFVVFRKEFGLSLGQIGFLVTYNFAIQITVDFLAANFAERIGCKKCIVTAHLFSAVGLFGLSVFPGVLPSPFVGLLLAITVYAIGGGLIEVLVSPIVEALPTDEKSTVMCVLHSFYCWGHALVVILSTVFFTLAGTENWRALAALWAIVPLGNAFLYAASPVLVLKGDGGSLSIGKLVRLKELWLLVLLMICSGASELSMSQWSSFFAESGLQVSKTVGDLLGPCMFAILMGLIRLFYAFKGNGISLHKFIIGSAALCLVSYLVAVFSPLPVLSLIACGVCGLAVGIMWPGVFSMSTEYCPQGGTAMFGLLALAGDIGCASGPSLVGFVSETMGGQLKWGLLMATLFPFILLIGVLTLNNHKVKRSTL